MPAPRPPSADPLVALADRCVQCGLCLPACPTYRHDGLEPESPRGRIAVVRAWELGTIPPTPAGDAHLDHCLGCRACEAVCPAGVRFGALLVEARGRQRARRPVRWMQRLVEAAAGRPRWLSAVLAMYRMTAPAWPAKWRPAPAPPPRDAGDPLHTRRNRRVETPAPAHDAGAWPVLHATPASLTAAHPQRAHVASAADGATAVPASPASPRTPVALFVGCAARAYESPVRAALARLLAAVRLDVVAPEAQTCCGSLHAHAGDLAAASRLAGRNAIAFAGHATIVTLASGCHESLAAALPAGSRAVDALTLIGDRLDALAFRPSREHVALHLPCTQRNVVGSGAALRRLLDAVPETTITSLDAGFGCCGAAGSQFLLDPARAADFRAPLLAQVHASGARRVLSANIGCRLHLQGGTAVPVEHPLEFLARHLVDTPAQRAATLDSPA